MKIKMRVKKWISVALMSVVCCSQYTVTAASTESISVSETKAKAEKQLGTSNEYRLDRSEVEAFSDDFVAEYMKEYHIPGGAVMVVQDGEVLFEKGYGYSDVAQKKAFTTNDTHFSIASITKTFTAAALMKLVQDGKVQLDEDILTYLPSLKLDNPYKDKITVEELLTHTSGIDSSFTEDLSYDEVNNEEPHHLLRLLNKRGVKVISKPGQFVEYSSYGTVVLGAIVEEVSQMSCEAYITKNILLPLEMQQTEMLKAKTPIVNGYIYGNDELVSSKLKGYFRMYPEGGLVSTVEDMRHYIEMFLSNGVYNEKTILEKSVIEEMLQEHAAFDELLPGMGYGFAEYKNQGIHSVGHAGYSSDGTLSEVVLYPEQSIGTFIVVNQGSNNNFQSDFRDAFIKKFLMEGNADQEEGTNLVEEDLNEKESLRSSIDNTNVAGTYRFSDYPRTNLYKANAFGTGEVEVKQASPSTISISGMDEFTFKAYTKEAEYIKPLTYKLKDEEAYMVFKTDNMGKVQYMAKTDSSSHGIYEKVRWYERGKIQVPFFGAALIIFAIQLVGSFIVFVVKKVRRMKKDKSKDKVIEDLTQESISRLMSAISLCFLGFFTYSMFFWGDKLRYYIPVDIYLSLALPIIALILTIVLIGFVAIEIRERFKAGKGRFKMIYHLSMAVLYSIFIIFMNYWNFIGYKL